MNATTFDMFITDIRGLKINAVSREEVYEKASKLFGAENQDLIVQLRELLYNVWRNVEHNTHAPLNNGNFRGVHS